jgi:hypothetical protein
MAVSRVKSWVAGEVLLASDLNAEFNSILNNGEDLGFPATKSKDFDSNELILDGDGDTSITADTDDQIDFRVGGIDALVLTTTTLVLAVSDSRTDTVDVPLTITSTTSGTPAADIGTGILLRAESADENPSDFGQLNFAASDVTGGSEDTYFDVLLRTAGAALGARWRMQATGAFNGILTHANSADRTYTLPDSDATLFGDPITTRGDVIRGDSSGNAERLALGADNTVLASDGTDAAWETFLSLMAASISSTQGDITYHNGTNWVNLGAGTSGQFLQTLGGGANPAWADPGFTIGTAQATTSGTSFNFTGIGAGANVLIVSLDGVSLDGTDDYLIQLGDSGGIETTGYASNAAEASGSADTSSTSGFVMIGDNATRIYTGAYMFFRVDGNDWVGSWNGVLESTDTQNGGGAKTLSAELTQVTLTRTGTDNFDAGQVNILWM